MSEKKIGDLTLLGIAELMRDELLGEHEEWTLDSSALACAIDNHKSALALERAERLKPSDYPKK